MKKRIIFYFLILCLGVTAGTDAPAAESSVDNSLYADLLSAYVKNGVVDYHGFKAEKKLDAYLRILESANTGKLTRDERFAFYINAYNAWTIKQNQRSAQ